MRAPPNLQVFLLLLGPATIFSKPYFDLGDSYEDMMRSVGRFPIIVIIVVIIIVTSSISISG